MSSAFDVDLMDNTQAVTTDVLTPPASPGSSGREGQTI
jgi:hypothetical protein